MTANSNKTSEALNTLDSLKPKLKPNGQQTWSKEDKAELFKAFVVLSNLAETYGKIIDPKAMVEHFEWALADEFTVGQILPALKTHSKKTDLFPTPAKINAILNPPEPRITPVEYMEAIKRQERNRNWSEYTNEAALIARFERQSSGAQDEWEKAQKALASARQAREIEYHVNDDLLIEDYSTLR